MENYDERCVWNCTLCKSWCKLLNIFYRLKKCGKRAESRGIRSRSCSSREKGNFNGKNVVSMVVVSVRSWGFWIIIKSLGRIKNTFNIYIWYMVFILNQSLNANHTQLVENCILICIFESTETIHISSAPPLVVAEFICLPNNAYYRCNWYACVIARKSSACGFACRSNACGYSCIWSVCRFKCGSIESWSGWKGARYLEGWKGCWLGRAYRFGERWEMEFLLEKNNWNCKRKKNCN